jgi:N-acylneuraminate cytidylyltransferase
MGKNVIAIIPARGGSKGIKRKNLRLVAGKPLVVHAIEQALSCKNIHRTIVNTEDQEIREVAASHGADVMGRPDEFIHDNTVQEVDRLLKWCILELENQGNVIDVIVLLYPTSPLRDVATIFRAVEMVTDEGYDSVLSLYENPVYLWRKDGDITAPTNYDPKLRGPRQKEDWNQWTENKAIYVMTRNLLVTTGCRLGGRIGWVEMPKWRSIDIDSEDDLKIASLLIEHSLI